MPPRQRNTVRLDRRFNLDIWRTVFAFQVLSWLPGEGDLLNPQDRGLLLIHNRVVQATADRDGDYLTRVERARTVG